MKKYIWVLILVAAGIVLYTQFFIPLSEEEKEVKALEEEFDAAAQQYVSAVRQFVEPGLAAVADPETAIERIKAAKAEAEGLKKRLTEEKALERMARLETKISEFYKKNNLE